MLFRNWIINARIGKGNQRDFFPIRSSLRVLQNSLSFFRVYDKCLLYCVLWTEWGFRYLSAFFHCRKRWKVLRQTFFQSPLIDLPFGAERFIILRRLILRIQVLENQVSFCFSESLRFFGLGQAFTAYSSRGKPCFSDINPFILAGELCWARTHR